MSTQRISGLWFLYAADNPGIIHLLPKQFLAAFPDLPLLQYDPVNSPSKRSNFRGIDLLQILLKNLSAEEPAFIITLYAVLTESELVDYNE